MGCVKLGVWDVVDCVGSLRCPLETSDVGCGQDRVRRTGGGEEVVLKRTEGISTILRGVALYASEEVNVVNVKVKQSHYRPGLALWVPRC